MVQVYVFFLVLVFLPSLQWSSLDLQQWNHWLKCEERKGEWRLQKRGCVLVDPSAPAASHSSPFLLLPLSYLFQLVVGNLFMDWEFCRLMQWHFQNDCRWNAACSVSHFATAKFTSIAAKGWVLLSLVSLNALIPYSISNERNMKDEKLHRERSLKTQSEMETYLNDILWIEDWQERK